MSTLLLSAPEMTIAGKLITYVIFPVLVILLTAGPIALWRGYRAAKGRAVALAIAATTTAARMDTQDQALARLLEVINPIGAPNLTAVLARIQADSASQARRLDDHIRTAAEDKRAFELRLVALTGGSG